MPPVSQAVGVLQTCVVVCLGVPPELQLLTHAGTPIRLGFTLGHWHAGGRFASTRRFSACLFRFARDVAVEVCGRKSTCELDPKRDSLFHLVKPHSCLDGLMREGSAFVSPKRILDLLPAAFFVSANILF